MLRNALFVVALLVIVLSTQVRVSAVVIGSPLTSSGAPLAQQALPTATAVALPTGTLSAISTIIPTPVPLAAASANGSRWGIGLVIALIILIAGAWFLIRGRFQNREIGAEKRGKTQ